MQQKIVLIGGPGTGKTTVLNELKNLGFSCMEEVSREVTLKAQKEGIDQLFLTQPLLFSEKLLEGRIQQFEEAHKSEQKHVFFDRGIPDVYAYMDFFKTDYPENFKEKGKEYNYTKLFIFPPWKNIYTSDNERYETFEQSQEIDVFLRNAYEEIGYTLIEVPFGSIEDRTNFILNHLDLKV
ncbi:AAA family ATPase [Tenacibaculum aquimarinum]|uniref:AAA family ATPase n=1 Tax=Tenacibaculum aquimarinum TaxID=2910675 RepID=UPI001F0A6389|nr:ATP-binding protein [Tenacibaculum aquimarinum]MCH3885569.1 ATP-binding protein [Tenacibaculum aquimarinum]